MSKVKVSVLVPVYNSAKFLRECLDSLVDQTMRELEFILVNDGSTDESLEIMEDYKNKDGRFKILDKKNTGYGDSLNQAMRLAEGEYVGVVEPDDYCSKKMFEVLYGLAKDGDFDIARGEYYECRGGQKEHHRMKIGVEKKSVFVPIKDYAVFYETPAIWSAIYKKEMIEKNGIEFLPTPGAAYQDAGFNFKTLACAKKVVYTNTPVYYYRMDNPNSSVKDLKKTMAVVREYKEIEKFVEKIPEGDLLVKYCQVAKFGAYHWNLQRLEKQAWMEFAETMKEEFVQELKQGNIEKAYFPKKYWASLSLLLKVPIGLYRFLFMAKKRLK